jgi:hypothetical protein
VASIGEVVARMRKALDSCADGTARLHDADQELGASLDALNLALAGAGDDESISLLRLALAAVGDARDAVQAAAQGVQQEVSRLDLGTAGGAATGGATAPPVRSAQPPAGPAAPTGRPSAEQIERLRDELPPTVVGGTGQKTHGRWIDTDGNEHAEVSGKDEKYDQAIQLFRTMKARRIPVRASDVEMKLAAHMRTKGIRSATLVVNNLPCEGPLGCDALVPVILPTGYTLTVHGPDGFVRVYEGGKTSSWLP